MKINMNQNVILLLIVHAHSTDMSVIPLGMWDVFVYGNWFLRHGSFHGIDIILCVYVACCRYTMYMWAQVSCLDRLICLCFARRHPCPIDIKWCLKLSFCGVLFLGITVIRCVLPWRFNSSHNLTWSLALNVGSHSCRAALGACVKSLALESMTS